MESILKAEKKVPLVDRVIDQLRCAICSGKLASGERLVEKEIADTIKVSRNAVREAFRYLEKEGFITIEPFKGAHVTVHTQAEIRQMFEVMSGLEGMCTRLAIENISQEYLKALDVHHAELEDLYMAGDHKSYLESNWLFHAAIHDIAGNDILRKMVEEFHQKITVYRIRQLFKPNRFAASIKEHRKIMHAFHSKNPDLGELRMREHLDKQSESLF